MSYDMPDEADYLDSLAGPPPAPRPTRVEPATDDTPAPHQPLVMSLDAEVRTEGPGGQLPSWSSISPFWLAYWTVEEIDEMTDHKLEMARMHFYPPPGPHPKPTKADHDTFRWLVDETQKRVKQLAARRKMEGRG